MRYAAPGRACVSFSISLVFGTLTARDACGFELLEDSVGWLMLGAQDRMNPIDKNQIMHLKKNVSASSLDGHLTLISNMNLPKTILITILVHFKLKTPILTARISTAIEYMQSDSYSNFP